MKRGEVCVVKFPRDVYGSKQSPRYDLDRKKFLPGLPN